MGCVSRRGCAARNGQFAANAMRSSPSLPIPQSGRSQMRLSSRSTAATAAKSALLIYGKTGGCQIGPVEQPQEHPREPLRGLNALRSRVRDRASTHADAERHRAIPPSAMRPPLPTTLSRASDQVANVQERRTRFPSLARGESPWWLRLRGFGTHNAHAGQP